LATHPRTKFSGAEGIPSKGDTQQLPDYELLQRLNSEGASVGRGFDLLAGELREQTAALD
jgi:uncharacterized protein YoaH (UPF0181 family)